MAKTKRQKMGKIYHNKTEIDGIIFDSQTEAEYYSYIKMHKKDLNINKIELQPKFLLQEKYILTDNQIITYSDENEKEFKKLQRKYVGSTIQAIYYIADFKLTYHDGSIDIIDVKGLKTADFKIKEKIFNFKYPKYGGLKCIVKYNKQWMTWEEKEKKEKEKRKEKKEKKKEEEKKEIKKIKKKK